MTEPSLASAARVSWFATASRGRLRMTLAAILLVLHWAVPNVFAFEAAPGQIEAGYSSAQYGAAPGTLPRLLTRTHGFEAESNRPQHSDDPPVEKAAAFHVAPLSAAPAKRDSDAVTIAASHISPDIAASFEARAPPSPQA